MRSGVICYRTFPVTTRLAMRCEKAISRKLVYFDAASTEYFKTLKIPLIAGRDFSENDTPASPLVAIANERFARSFFPGSNPIGKTFEHRRDGGKA